MVTFGNTIFDNIYTEDNFKAKSCRFGDKSTYRTEYYDSENDIDRQLMLANLVITTEFNSKNNKRPDKISSKCLRKLSKNDYYIKLLECRTHNIIFEKLNVFQIASIYFENINNICKLNEGKKCVLSYIHSVFANINHKALLTRLNVSIEKYLKEIHIYTILNLYKPEHKTPEQVFDKKRHTPPP